MPAISAITETPADECRVSQDGTREYERQFLVKCDHSQLTYQDSVAFRLALWSARPDLRIFSPHPGDREAYVTDVDAKRQSRWLWEVSVSYSTSVEEGASLDLKERQPPLQEPPKITIATVPRKKVVETDIRGDVLANTAGDPFTDIEINSFNVEITIRKNVVAVPAWVYEYMNTTNDAAVRIKGKNFKANTLLVTGLTEGEEELRQRQRYTPLTIKLEWRAENWLQVRLNTGRREKLAVQVRPPSSLTKLFLFPIEDEKGSPVDEPWMLDRFGRAYREDIDNTAEQILKTATAGKKLRNDLEKNEIVTRVFEVYKEKPFARLLRM